MASFDAEAGVVGIVGLARIRATEPFTLLAVSARERDRSIEVLAVRAIFYGRGRTVGGYQMFNGYPLVACTRAWPVAGFGPSYPVHDLQIHPGDAVQLVFYARSKEAGRRSLSGYKIEYRGGKGGRRTASGDTLTFDMHLYPAGGRPREDHVISPCHPDRPIGWVEPAPGFPG